VRIIAGSLKGRRLLTPTWEGLRPTSDKLRETLFNVLAPRIGGARVLDGFAGTGALGIEALSRGAAHVVFIELDRRAQGLIADNLARCGVVEGYTVIRASVSRGLSQARVRPDFAPFDIVLLDPPYDESMAAALEGIDEVVAPQGIVVLEHARRRPAPERSGRLGRVRELRAGDSALAFYSDVPVLNS
jgi:16S rRNA (guanine(966)-N(2))-methyltransferase RsmD